MRIPDLAADSGIKGTLDLDKIPARRGYTKRVNIGTINVTAGKLTKFTLAHEPNRTEHFLALCAVPSLSFAASTWEDAYWDGLFSDTPGSLK